jgi:hypothetical protein
MSNVITHCRHLMNRDCCRFQHVVRDCPVSAKQWAFSQPSISCNGPVYFPVIASEGMSASASNASCVRHVNAGADELFVVFLVDRFGRTKSITPSGTSQTSGPAASVSSYRYCERQAPSSSWSVVTGTTCAVF